MKNWLSKFVLGTTALGLSAGLAYAQPGGTITMPLQTSTAVLQKAQLVGPHAASSTIGLTFGLKLNHVARLKTFLRNLQNPKSSQYHNFLPPEQFTAQYGPTPAQVDAVVQFLKQNGITVKDVSSNRILIHTQAPTGVYERALGIGINDYTLDGRTFYSTKDAPSLPRAIAPLVVNVLGLNHGVQMRPLSYWKPMRSGPKPKETPPPPSLDYFNPGQIATAYAWPDITDPANGAGVSVAILTAESASIGSNASPHTFWAAFGLPDHTINVIPVDGTGITDPNAMFETILDISWSGAMAPGITQNVYVAADASLDTFADMYNQFVTDNTSQVMTTSWGIAEAADPTLFTSDEEIFMQGAAQGISMFAAAGDHGSSDCIPFPGFCPPGDNNADYPSSSVYITAANGTQLNISDLNGTYDSEVVWNDSSCFGGGPLVTGGAVSQLFAEPDWQTGPGVPDNGARNNSDMAMNASCTHPYLLFMTGVSGVTPGWYFSAGTSAVAPQFAGLFAVGVSMNGGTSLGLSNELIYDDVNAGNYGSDFRDVTVGNNGAFEAGPNWDHPTGWGSPRATNLLTHIIGGSGNTCPAGYSEYDGSLAAGKIAHSPIYTAPAGEENAILTAETGFRLFAGTEINGQQKIYRIPGNEIHRQAPAGRYTWIVKAGDTSGTYTLCVNHP